MPCIRNLFLPGAPDECHLQPPSRHRAPGTHGDRNQCTRLGRIRREAGETVALLREAAQLGPATQASSLGAEDMVITHLINAHALPISIFVLETGALHAETLALLEQLQAQQATHPHAP
jgi:3'-phosphoadenosine 5'-phosphosulfate sulfotransferase (PAPS reductase)/FAD synthetase